MDRSDILEGIKNQGLYDFISNNGHRLSKDQLKDIIKELDFIIYDENKKHHAIVTEKLIESLEETFY